MTKPCTCVCALACVFNVARVSSRVCCVSRLFGRNGCEPQRPCLLALHGASQCCKHGRGCCLHATLILPHSGVRQQQSRTPLSCFAPSPVLGLHLDPRVLDAPPDARIFALSARDQGKISATQAVPLVPAEVPRDIATLVLTPLTCVRPLTYLCRSAQSRRCPFPLCSSNRSVSSCEKCVLPSAPSCTRPSHKRRCVWTILSNRSPQCNSTWASSSSRFSCRAESCALHARSARPLRVCQHHRQGALLCTLGVCVSHGLL